MKNEKPTPWFNAWISDRTALVIAILVIGALVMTTLRLLTKVSDIEQQHQVAQKEWAESEVKRKKLQDELEQQRTEAKEVDKRLRKMEDLLKDLQAQVHNDTELSIAEAARDFIEEQREAREHLNDELDIAFARLKEELMNKAEDLDGYIARAQNDQKGVEESLKNVLNAAYADKVSPAFQNFEEAYSARTEKMHAMLFTAGSESLRMSPSDPKLRTGGAEQELARELRSKEGLMLKGLDDGFEAIPIFGDLWGVVKIFYDPRVKKTIEPRVGAVVHAARKNLQDKTLAEIDRTAPTEEFVIQHLHARVSEETILTDRIKRVRAASAHQ